MNHSQSPQWNTFFIYSTDLGEWPTNMNNEAKYEDQLAVIVHYVLGSSPVE